MPSAIQASTVQGQATDIPTIRSQLGDLQVQLTGLQAKWDGLHTQLDAMLRSNPARPGVQQQWADVGVEIARVKGEIAYREAQLARAQGRPIGTTETAPAGRFPIRPVNSNLIVVTSAAMLFAFGLPLSIAWARRILGRKPEPPSPSNVAPRLGNIERAIDAIAIEVERISENQRFLTKILVDTRPNQGSATESSAPSPRALGAGPIQPIEVPERERARQRMITPH